MAEEQLPSTEEILTRALDRTSRKQFSVEPDGTVSVYTDTVRFLSTLLRYDEHAHKLTEMLQQARPAYPGHWLEKQTPCIFYRCDSTSLHPVIIRTRIHFNYADVAPWVILNDRYVFRFLDTDDGVPFGHRFAHMNLCFRLACDSRHHWYANWAGLDLGRPRIFRAIHPNQPTWNSYPTMDLRLDFERSVVRWAGKRYTLEKLAAAEKLSLGQALCIHERNWPALAASGVRVYVPNFGLLCPRCGEPMRTEPVDMSNSDTQKLDRR